MTDTRPDKPDTQDRLLEAVAHCERNPGNPDHWLALGELLYSNRLLQQAHDVYLDALKLHPGDARLHVGLGNVFDAGDEKQSAATCYRNALARDPASVAALYNLGVISHSRRDFTGAIRFFQEALRVDPGYAACYTPLIHMLRQCCRWDEAGALVRRYREHVAAGMASDISPFSIITLPDSTASEQRHVAEAYTDRLLKDVEPLPPAGKARLPSAGKIRLGFLSADFFNHATSILAVRLLELLDTRSFELFAYSSGPDDGSVLRRRVVNAFCVFREVATMSDEAVARRIREDGIDVLIDMKGFTQDSRSRVLAYRPAAVQVSYLGYPATMDRRLVDYLIADDIVIPPGDESNYAETIVRLPFCYQPNDNQRQVPVAEDRRARRQRAGFADDAIVLGVFQQNYKLHPALLSCWADILRAVPAAVLWCLHSNGDAKKAMEAFFTGKGISAQRLCWGEKVGQQDHLDRLTLVDLALDSWPVNGHTSTADALWAGTPVLTLAGDTFVSRVAGSLLHAAGLPDFVTHTREEYTARGIELCLAPERLSAAREHLYGARLRLPLFDSERYARDFGQLIKALVTAHRSPEPALTSPTGS